MMRTALGLALAAAPAWAATYYVAPPADGGSNANPGSASLPWATLQHAANNLFPGDTVIVAPGTYAGFNAVRSGTSAAPITYSGLPGAHINAAAAPHNGTNHRSRVNLDTVSWIIVEGFEITGTNDLRNSQEGVRIVSPLNADAGHITIRNNHIHHNGNRNILSGFVSDLVIEHNVCHHAYREHGIYVSNSGDRHVIRHNVSYSNSNNGLHMNGDASLGGDGVMSELVVDSNVFWDNGAGGVAYIDANGNAQVSTGGGSAINGDGVRDSRIVNNIAHYNHASGISLYRIDGGQPSSNNLVANNTIVNAPNARWCLNIQDGSTGNVAFNNILINLNIARGAVSISTSSLAGFACDSNLLTNRFDLGGSFLTLAQWRTQTGLDVQSALAAPADLPAIFAAPGDALDADFHLTEGSPAIDAGVASWSGEAAPAFDIDAQPRPAGEGFDIGADERAPCAIVGDINGDGAVDFADLSRLLDAFGASLGDAGFDPAADLDNDLDVDFADLNALLSVFNQSCR